MSILLINPPAPFLAFANAAPHIGVGYLISYLRDYGMEVNYLNLESTDPDDVKIPEGYDYYGITSVTLQYFFAKLVHQQIVERKLGKTIIGGGHASIMPQECLADGFDYVVRGYGEIALLGILDGKQFPGIIQGTMVENLDALSFPAWGDLLRDKFDASYGNHIAHIFSQRGCHFDCHYCCSPAIYGTQVRQRSISNVIFEIRSLKERYGVDSIYFFDPTLTIVRKRAIELAEGLFPLDMDWTGQTRVDKIDPELLRTLKRAGCNQISFGIETGSTQTHQTLGKDTTVKENEDAIKMAHDVGMRVKVFLMGALPDENEKSAELFKEFILKNKPDDWLYSTFIPLPGTAYWKDPEKFGIEILCKDFRTYYPLGVNARGPVNINGRYLKRDQLVETRNDILDFLRKEVPNKRVEQAIDLFKVQKPILMKFFKDLDTDYIF